MLVKNKKNSYRIVVLIKTIIKKIICKSINNTDLYKKLLLFKVNENCL
jgi:hypothetical protein